MSVSQSQPCADGESAARTEAEPSAAFTPGMHLQAISAAFFNGGGWVDPLCWDDFDAEGQAEWEAFAEVIGRDIRCAVAAPDLLTVLRLIHERPRVALGGTLRRKVREVISKALTPSVHDSSGEGSGQ